MFIWCTCVLYQCMYIEFSQQINQDFCHAKCSQLDCSLKLGAKQVSSHKLDYLNEQNAFINSNSNNAYWCTSAHKEVW